MQVRGVGYKAFPLVDLNYARHVAGPHGFQDFLERAVTDILDQQVCDQELGMGQAVRL